MLQNFPLQVLLRLAITEGALSTLVKEIGLLCFSDLVGETDMLYFSVLTIMEEAS